MLTGNPPSNTGRPHRITGGPRFLVQQPTNTNTHAKKHHGQWTNV